jgi:hypothetical protein
MRFRLGRKKWDLAYLLYYDMIEARREEGKVIGWYPQSIAIMARGGPWRLPGRPR